jgi:hypothetical protein
MADSETTTPDVLGADITEVTVPQPTSDQDASNTDAFALTVDPMLTNTATVTQAGLLAQLCAELRLQGRGISHTIEGLLAQAADHFGI